MPNFSSIGSGVTEPQVADNRYLALTGGIGLTTVYALTCYALIIIFIMKLVHQYIKNVKKNKNKKWLLNTQCHNSKNNVSQIKHRDSSKIILNMQQFLNHINFIKLMNYDSLLMNLPDKLFVNFANNTRKHVPIVAAKYSITTNGSTRIWFNLL